MIWNQGLNHNLQKIAENSVTVSTEPAMNPKTNRLKLISGVCQERPTYRGFSSFMNIMAVIDTVTWVLMNNDQMIPVQKNVIPTEWESLRRASL
jgi:hypothetical protein